MACLVHYRAAPLTLGVQMDVDVDRSLRVGLEKLGEMMCLPAGRDLIKYPSTSVS